MIIYAVLIFYMKRVLLSIAIIWMALPTLGQSFHYYPLKEVKDTISYLKLNFDDQSSYFKGSPDKPRGLGI